MAQTLQHKRGITAELAPQVGTVGEIMMDTAKNTLVVMDGVTAGGHPMAKESNIPVNVSELNNDAGYITSEAAFSGAYDDLTGKPALFGGDYNDLTNKPSLFSGAYTDLTGKPTLFSGSYTDLTNKPSLFSGSYTDLTNKPTLFSGAYDDLTGTPNLSTYQLTIDAFNGNYNDLENKPSIPTDVSDLTDTEGLLGGGSGSGDTLTNSTQTFSLDEEGNAVFSGEIGGVNRGLVWDYGANTGGENSTVRQDNNGLSVRAWTEVGEGEEVYSAPVNIRTNQGDNEKWWTFDGNGDLYLPEGGSITEGVVTDNPTIEITPANSSVESQKLVIKGGGGYYAEANGIWINLSNVIFQVGNTVNVYVGSETYAEQTLYWWIVPEEGGISDPGFGTVTLDESGLGNFSFEVDSEDEFTVRVSQVENVYDPTTGVESLTINGDVGDHHLHLTTGALNETSIILGTDEHNVRTTIEGKIQITTPGESSNVWEFDTDGNLTLPGGMTIGNFNGVPAIQGNVDTPIGILAQGSTGAATLQWVDDFENATSISAVVVNSQFANTGDVQIITGNVGPTPEHSWTFGADGSLTFPLNGGGSSGKINPGVSDGGGLQIEAEYDFEIKVTQFEDDPTIWSFAGNDITFPDGSIQPTAWTGEAPYTNGANSGVWGDPIPTTVSEAIDRIANALYSLGANTAI
jgi:hypothetical protein